MWRSIRRRRAAPPGAASDSTGRAATFRGALEQAEQQFRAAASVDYDSRALNLYYGASQAGRAVAAAATTLGGDEWALHGHGLKRPNLSHIATDLASVRVSPDHKPNASFTRLSQVLHSPTDPATLGDLWPLMYETNLYAPLTSTLYPPLLFSPQQRHLVGGQGVHGIDQVQVSLPEEVRRMTVAERPPLKEYLARYPALTGWRTTTPTGGNIGWPGRDRDLNLQFELSAADATSGHIVGDRSTQYRGFQMAFPTLAEETTPLHPLMAWWAVLYTLSMATRYDPAQWTALINIDRTQQATAIEFVLDTALAAVPDLLDEAIDFVSEQADSMVTEPETSDAGPLIPMAGSHVATCPSGSEL